MSIEKSMPSTDLEVKEKNEAIKEQKFGPENHAPYCDQETSAEKFGIEEFRFTLTNESSGHPQAGRQYECTSNRCSVSTGLRPSCHSQSSEIFSVSRTNASNLK